MTDQSSPEDAAARELRDRVYALARNPPPFDPGVTEPQEPMMPAVYWPLKWLSDLFRSREAPLRAEIERLKADIAARDREEKP